MIGVLVLLGVALAALIAVLTALLVHEMTHPPRHTAGYAIARGMAADPGDMGLAYEQWWLDCPDGVRLPVWEVKALGSAPGTQRSEAGSLDEALKLGHEKSTAVFVHGWGHSRIDMLPRAATWAELCDRLIFHDLRGHGEATGTSRLGDGEERDLAALLERLGPGKCVLVGHSMGAVIAINAAAAAVSSGCGSCRVVGVVAYGPYAEFHPSLRGRLRGAGLPTRPMTDLALLWLRLRGVRPAGSLSAASRLAVPLLVVHGAGDEMVAMDDVRRIVSAAAGAELLEVPEAGHLDAHALGGCGHDDAIRAFVGRVMNDRSRSADVAVDQPGRAAN